ncbi:hypothetical protein Ctob_007459 [Chrysochromulina tobinii]|uniref:Uncharacterized protein n=1 Tax=Chrysochromulina tobinii TaxID=1460289 RepID=A0A0M0K3P7_9EUKA|nr:hypothetical protein Ctob_007459 [Chrysochromulina tobinii]|eukprot:KOO33242.1 hypothetical protein Ctob_007459 [Chrysochromulina sp. CCMP291]
MASLIRYFCEYKYRCTGCVPSGIPEAPEGSGVFELLDGAACHRQLGVLDWALSLGFAPGPRLLQRLIVDRFDREPGEPDEEETPLVALRWAHAHGFRLPEDACKLAIGASKLRTLQVR